MYPTELESKKYQNKGVEVCDKNRETERDREKRRIKQDVVFERVTSLYERERKTKREERSLYISN